MTIESQMNTQRDTIMKRLILTLILPLILIACGGGTQAPDPIIPPVQVSTNDAFGAVLQQHQVPAIGGVYIEEGQVLEQFVLGVRKEGTSTQVSIDDRWHLGSITKSFTATLAAVLIEMEYLAWQTTIGEVFDANEYYQKYANVTLEQLLSHTGGIHGEIIDTPGWDNYFTRTDELMDQRKDMVSAILHMQGNGIGNFTYSNGSFVIAGAMMERIMGSSWEYLLEEYLLLPLDIQDVQYGAPTSDVVDGQLVGHDLISGSWSPVEATSLYSDNPKAMGPAGTLSMSLASLTKYVVDHMGGISGQSTILTSSSYERLHQKVSGTDYAMGWFINGTNVYHMGTNTLWYAHVGIDFGSKTVGVIAVTNVGGDRGTAVTDNIIDVLLDRNY